MFESIDTLINLANALSEFDNNLDEIDNHYNLSKVTNHEDTVGRSKTEALSELVDTTMSSVKYTPADLCQSGENIDLPLPSSSMRPRKSASITHYYICSFKKKSRKTINPGGCCT